MVGCKGVVLAECGGPSGSRIFLVETHAPSEERGVYDDERGVLFKVWIYAMHDTPFSSGTSFEMA